MDEWDERRRRRRTIFDIFDELFSEIWEEMEELERRFSEFAARGFESSEMPGKPIVYGFRIEIGPDGRPKIYEFGNVRRMWGRARPKVVVTEEAEPLVDIFEEDDTIKVVVEMPGVDKEKIRVRAVDDRHIIVEGSDHGRKYRKEIELPTDADVESARATYRNGILEIVLRKKRGGERGKIIEVE